jgi:hypothetical protein
MPGHRGCRFALRNHQEIDMADAKKTPRKQSNEDHQLAQRGEKQGTESGRSGGVADGSGQAAQTRPGASAPGGQSPEQDQDALHGSQGLAGAQGSGGGAERGMQQDPDQRRRTPGSQNR